MCWRRERALVWILNMASSKAPLWVWLSLPAVVMSLGWALRGFIGGGPLGAMIPGALVALILAVLLDVDDSECGWIAACGAVGIGFGGQETYGQTAGLSFQPETFWWAILGFAIKGAVWGLLGGAVMGIAFMRERVCFKDMFVGGGLMVLATYVGWKLINAPKLVYFSNRFDKPREELYAGLLLGALVLLAWMLWRTASKTPSWFALWGALGGGIGFAGGAWIQVIGRGIQPHIWVGWWKVMELTFGVCLGLACGVCAWRNREELMHREPRPVEAPRWWSIAVALVVIALALVAGEAITLRFPYTIVGAVLLCLMLMSERLAWHVAITMTSCAFFIDVAKAKPEYGQVALAVTVTVATLAVAVCVERWPGKRAMLVLLTTVSVGVALCKLFVPPMAKGEGPAVMGGLFVLMAVVGLRWVKRVSASAAAMVVAALVFAPAAVQGAGPLSAAALDWKLDLGQATSGGPVHVGTADATDGVLIALGSGKVVLVSPRGERVATMDLDLAAACPPVAGAGKIHAADAWGAIYAFDLHGKRL